MRIEHDTLLTAQRALGYTFRDIALLDLALTHASITDSRVDSNERLEFLGDAVLGMIVCDYLFQKYPALLEGDLTKIKSAAVSRRMCARIAAALGLDTMLLLGKGMKTRAALPASLSAAVLESAIGAIYLDGGLDAARAFLIPLLAPHIDQAASSGHQQNFKSVLQHVAQQRFEASPLYLLVDEKGPDHAKCFEVAVELNGRRFASSWAASKKQAEQQAALRVLEELGLIQHTDDGHIVFIGSGDLEPTPLDGAPGAPGAEGDSEAVIEAADHG
ncbi:MAG TPA: ribonuclease III [Phycisphaerales bacterium]|nr:ribonuclease III [Phycisphaerales bacterium]